MDSKLTVAIDGNSYDLPKRTPAIAKKFDEFNEVFSQGNDVKTHYKACDVIEAVLGKDNMKEIFETTDREKISTLDSVLAVKRIDDAYMEPIRMYERQKDEESANSPVFEKLNEVGESVSKLEKMINIK